MTFTLMQDQARATQQNRRVSKTKAKAVQNSTKFRPQVAITKFKRNYQATYGDPQQAAKVEHGRVTSTTGETFPLKTIKIVPVGAAAVSAGTVHAIKLRDGGVLMLLTLQNILSDVEPMAMSKASKELREEFAAQGKHYDTTMNKMAGN